MILRPLVAASILGLVGAAAALQQPGSQPPAQPPESTQPQPSDDREALQARLERRLEESKQSQAKIEKALKMLEEGEPTDKVREEAGGLFRRPGGDQPGGPGPRRRGPDGDGPPRQHGAPIAREAILTFLDQNNPELAARLRDNAKTNSEDADRILARIEPHFREITAERDQQMRELRTKNLRLGWELMSNSRTLGESLRNEKVAEADQARARIRELLGSQFDLQVQIQDREITLLEKRLLDLRKKADERTSGRDAYIEEKLTQIESMAKRWRERASEGQRPEHRKPPGGPESPKR
jgi:hypothetical protein